MKYGDGNRMEYKDYYKILGVEKNATQDEIKRAYRKLARKFHPDVNKEPDAVVHFKEIGEAYEVLKDTEKRAAYDQFGKDWKTGPGFTPPPGWEFREFTGGKRSASSSAQGFSDFFEALFGTGQPQRPRGEFSFFDSGFEEQGSDIRAKLEITLEESFSGCRKTIALQRDNPVSHGYRDETTSLQVSIPKGILEGQQIRLEGQGGKAFNSSRRGDLFLEVVFLPHAIFQVSQRDVTMTLPVTPWEAALGATIKVPTLGGPVELKLPSGSQSGRKMRLKGKGLSSHKHTGDQFVILAVHTPKAVTDEQRQLYEMMAKIMPFNPRNRFGV